MRRGSLVGPLILIAIGLVFLVKNIRPDLPLFDMVMTYWPFLLMGWGALRAVEILVTYFRGGNLPATGVGGGEWALIIILTVIGSSVWGVQRFTRDNFGRLRVGGIEVFGETFDYTVDNLTAKTSKAPRVVIDNPRGNTRVTVADIEEIRVSGRKTVKAMNQAEADRANQQTKVELNSAGDTVTVNGNQERASGQRVSADLEVVVPRGASIETRGRYGDVEISDVTGEVSVSSDNAGVRLQNIAGKVKVDTRRSDIIRAMDLKSDLELKGRGRDLEIENVAGQVAINGSYSGETTLRKLARPVRFESSMTEFRAERIPGELQLSLSKLSATNLVGPVVLKAKSKDIQLTDVTESIDLDIDRGDVEIRQSKAPLAKIGVKVHSGDIELALPPQAHFTLNATTDRGEVTNDFDNRLKQSNGDPGAKLSGSLGPGPEIHLATSRGSLTVRKVGPAEMAEEHAPAAPAKPPAPAPVPPAPPRANNQ